MAHIMKASARVQIVIDEFDVEPTHTSGGRAAILLSRDEQLIPMSQADPESSLIVHSMFNDTGPHCHFPRYRRRL